MARSKYGTLHAAFTACEARGTGYITDKERFASVARSLVGENVDVDGAWGRLDLDGNGAASFPEFVEWASAAGCLLEPGMSQDAEFGLEGVPLPHSWQGPKGDERWNKRYEVRDGELFAELQHTMNASYKKVWTRDRKATGSNDVPERFVLTKALHSENYVDWKRYYIKRHQLVRECSRAGGCEWFQPTVALTSDTHLSKRHRLHLESCNEWLLFHGTSPKAVESICGGDFTMHLAGTATGTLYGRGTYFAESITKADEYASPDPQGNCVVLLCRVAGGRVLYTAEAEPDADKLQEMVQSGRYHAIIGDREKCRGTFKEYIIFDADQVFVEYALFYKRDYGN